MSRLASYLDTEETATLEDHVGDLREIVDLLEKDSDQTTTALRLLDGMETFYQHTRQLGFESFEGLGVEGFSDVIDRAWRAILRWLKNLQAYLANFRNVTWSALKVVEAAADNERMHLEDRGVRSGNTFMLRSRVNGISLRYRPLTDAQSLLNALRGLELQSRSYYEWHKVQLERNAGGLVRRIGTMKGPGYTADMEATLSGFVDKVSPMSLVRNSGIRFTEDSQLGSALVAPPVLNNRRLVLYLRRGQPSSIKDFNSVSLRLEHAESNPRPTPDEIEFRHFPYGAHRQLIDQVKNLTGLLKEYHGSDSVRHHKALIRDCQQMVEEISKEAQGLPDGDGGLKNRHYDLLQLVRTLSDWASNPYIAMTNNALQVMRSTLGVLAHNRR